jgi:hypothetical protein
MTGAADQRSARTGKPRPLLVNLTPHPVTIIDERNAVVVEFPSRGLARAVQVKVSTDPVAGIPTSRMELTHVEALPEPAKGVLLIVSLITANAARELGRQCHDLLVPGPGIRNESGGVIGCRELIWFQQNSRTTTPTGVNHQSQIVRQRHSTGRFGS